MDGGMEPGLAARAAFDALAGGVVPDLARRRADLAALRAGVLTHAEDLARAVDADFGGRPRVETMLAEVSLALSHIDWTRKRLRGWMAPRRVALPPEYMGSRGRVARVPLGRVAVLAPWNYPVQLSLVPMIAALAGGNRVLLRPSEFTPRTAEVLAAIVGTALPDTARVVLGGADVARAVTALPLDGLFYTGSAATGRLVMAAAAANLVPVTLELGGKCPAIWLPEIDTDEAATSVMAGKLFSAGQTCVAPDYLMVPRARLEEVVEALRRATGRVLPEGSEIAALLRDGARERLLRLMEGHRAVPLMEPMPAAPRLGAYAVIDPDPISDLMQEEIFGPVLPIVPYEDLDQAEAFINARDCPLALYVYGRDRVACEGVVARVRSGGAMIGDCLLQVAAHTLPFGGAGASGMGSYHGEEGFRTFTRPRSVMTASRWSPVLLGRRPYGARVERLIRFLLR